MSLIRGVNLVNNKVKFFAKIKKYLDQVYLDKVFLFLMAIQFFSDSAFKIFFETGKIHKKAKWKNLRQVILRKLDMLHYAHLLEDLRSPPGNHLEALKGELKGFHSIRINKQWRIIFKWTSEGPTRLQIIDYH